MTAERVPEMLALVMLVSMMMAQMMLVAELVVRKIGQVIMVAEMLALVRALVKMAVKRLDAMRSAVMMVTILDTNYEQVVVDSGVVMVMPNADQDWVQHSVEWMVGLKMKV